MSFVISCENPKCEATDTERCPRCGQYLCTFCGEDDKTHECDLQRNINQAIELVRVN